MASQNRVVRAMPLARLELEVELKLLYSVKCIGCQLAFESEEDFQTHLRWPLHDWNARHYVQPPVT